MIETALLSLLIAGALHLARTRAGQARELWRQARWYEKALLVLAVLPIPGPVDELLGVLVVRRILARR